MGGSLFELGRVKRSDYVVIEKELRDYFEKKFPPEGGRALFRIPRYYDSKPDFGDVDILLSTTVVTDWKQQCKEITNDLGVSTYKIKPGLCMVYRDIIQVDIMITPLELLDTTWQFLCYNDLGNLLGKHFRRFNLKYGEKGLLYVYRRDNNPNYKKEILLTRDMRRILGFLELSFEEWERGFKTLEHMFDWVIACKYFTAEPFIILSASTARRAKLRTTMRKFVQYVEENNITKAYNFGPKDEYLPMIKEKFPDIPLDKIFEEERVKEQRENVIRSKYSGKLVMQLIPELKGPSLGKFMSYFKSQYEDFDDAIFNMDEEEVKNNIFEAHKSFSSI